MDKEDRLAWVVRLEEADAAVQDAEAGRIAKQEELYALVRQAVEAGMPQVEIAGTLGISRQRVNQIVLAGQKEDEQ